MARIDETRPFIPVRIAVLTVSDTRSLSDDKSGQTLADRITEAGHVLAARDIRNRAPDDLPLHLGITAGSVFAGAVGPAYRRTYTIMGDAVNLAARIMDKAPAGEVYATQEVLDAYRAAIETSDQVIAGLPLSAPPRLPEAWWQEVGMSFPDLRSVVLHVLVDTAVHAGHLDAARELIDGHQHIVL